MNSKKGGKTPGNRYMYRREKKGEDKKKKRKEKNELQIFFDFITVVRLSGRKNNRTKIAISKEAGKNQGMEEEKEIINPVRCRCRFLFGHRRPRCHQQQRRFRVVVAAGVVAEGNALS